ncbi:hypothetical protein [Methylomonas sp. MgM2]
MSVALRLYEQLTEAGEDRTRAKAIADAFEQLEERYPNLKDVATESHVRETELRLQKEIKEVEAKLQKEIKEIDIRIKEVEARLQKELREIDLRIKDVDMRITQVEARLTKEIKDVEIKLTQAIHRQTIWVIGSVGAVISGIRLLEWFLAHMPTH